MSHEKNGRSTPTTTRRHENPSGTNFEPTTQTASPEQRTAMIQMAAYLRAERRGFQGGDPAQDWLEAEREVDAILRPQTRRTPTTKH